MQAIILNSGTGSRMGGIDKPKCLLPIGSGGSVLHRQISCLIDLGFSDFIITTGFYHDAICSEVNAQNYKARFSFVKNELYDSTNYIYSMHLIKDLIRGDVVLLHGDLVFEKPLISNMLNGTGENLALVNQDAPLPEKDFKAKIQNGIIKGVSVTYTGGDCKFLLPFYKMKKESFLLWLDQISVFVSQNNVNVYAEEALNQIADKIKLKPFYFSKEFCMEIDTPEDYKFVTERMI